MGPHPYPEHRTCPECGSYRTHLETLAQIACAICREAAKEREAVAAPANPPDEAR